MSDTRARGRIGGFLTLLGLLSVIWIAAGRSAEPTSLAAGAVLASGIAAVLSCSDRLWRDVGAAVLRPIELLLYLAAFGREIVRSNLNLLGYVYAPRLRLSPAIVSVPTDLATPAGRFALTSTVTLTPGTLTLDLIGNAIRLHVLDMRSTDAEAARRAMTGPFERRLARVLG